MQQLEIVLAGDPSRDRRALAREAERGRMTRVRSGAYVSTDRWRELAPRARYLVLLEAVAAGRRQEVVFSHWSAALLHGLPLVGPMPALAHTIAALGRGARPSPDIRIHRGRYPAPDIVEVAGMRATSLPRTILDLAAVGAIPSAVAAADRALHRPRYGVAPLGSLDELQAHWERMMPFRGHARARFVVAFADGRAGSPLESESRYVLHALGAPAPELQVELRDHEGLIGFSDFGWEECALVGEADGDAKYLDPQLRGGLTADQVVLREKKREDRIRGIGRGVVRWDPAVVADRPRFARRLLSAGLPLRRAR